MCGCRGNKSNTTVSRTSVQARRATIQEPTVQMEFIGVGSNLLFVGQSTGTRYYVSSGNVYEVFQSDSIAFSKYVQNGKHIFVVVDYNEDPALGLMNELAQKDVEYVLPPQMNETIELSTVVESAEEVTLGENIDEEYTVGIDFVKETEEITTEEPVAKKTRKKKVDDEL